MHPNITYVESDPDGMPFYIYRVVRGRRLYWGKEAMLRMATARIEPDPTPPDEGRDEMPVHYEV